MYIYHLVVVTNTNIYILLYLTKVLGDTLWQMIKTHLVEIIQEIRP